MKPIPIKKRCITQPFVAVGCIIKKENKYLLVQEAVAERGKWNQPAGWLDFGEKLIDGAKREAEEETGLKIKIIGLLGAYSLIKTENKNIKTPVGLRHVVKFIFAAKPLTDQIKFDPEELLAAQWFTLKEIKKLGNLLRDHDIIQEIKDYESKKIYSLDVVNKFSID